MSTISLKNMIELQVKLIRSEGYSMLRVLNPLEVSLKNIHSLLAETLIETFLVLEESSAVNRIPERERGLSP